MGTKLSNAPVYYTVAQVQFNPVLDLETYIPAIQAKMREAHFTDFKKAVAQRVDFQMLGAQQGQMISPSMSTQTRYLFGDKDEQTAFLLEANALTLQTTAYDTFETFSASLIHALEVLHSVLRLDFVERIGLRYLDAILPFNKNESFTDFLVPEVLGLAMRGHGRLHHSISETAIDTEAGLLVSRVVVRSGQVGLPTDLLGVAIKINPRFLSYDGPHAIVDTDASLVRREQFELARIQSRLGALHGEIGASFRATVTDHARSSWA